MLELTLSLLFLFYLLFCIIVAYYLCRWFVKQLIQSRWGKKHAIIVDYRQGLTLLFTPLCALVVYVLLSFMVLFGFSHFFYNETALPFNQAEWLSQPDKRYQMTQDLLAQRHLIGKTQAEVIALLGDDYFRNNAREMVYTVGFASSFMALDPDVLIISFQDERVVDVAHRKD